MSQSLQPKSPQNRNFLKFKPLKRFLQSSLYPGIFQWLAVLIFAVSWHVRVLPFLPEMGRVNIWHCQ